MVKSSAHQDYYFLEIILFQSNFTFLIPGTTFPKLFYFKASLRLRGYFIPKHLYIYASKRNRKRMMCKMYACITSVDRNMWTIYKISKNVF